MDCNEEYEICNHCKREIPQQNYVIHSIHCARNVTKCNKCEEPIMKSEVEEHVKECKPKPKKRSLPPPTTLEKSVYFQTRKAVEDKKAEARKEKYMERMNRLVGAGHSLKESSDRNYQRSSVVNLPTLSPNIKPVGKPDKKSSRMPLNQAPVNIKPNKTFSKMPACKFCELQLPKVDLEEHEFFCGSRTDKCLQCGTLVMFKDKPNHLHFDESVPMENGAEPSGNWDATNFNKRSLEGNLPPSSAYKSSRPNAFEQQAHVQHRKSVEDEKAQAHKDLDRFARSSNTVNESFTRGTKDPIRKLDLPSSKVRSTVHEKYGSIPAEVKKPDGRFINTAMTKATLPYNGGIATSRNSESECKFCGLELPTLHIEEHENYCDFRVDPVDQVDEAAALPQSFDLFGISENERPPFSPQILQGAKKKENAWKRGSGNKPSKPDYQPAMSDVVIPCEFCDEAVPIDDVILHQTGCRPDLARYEL